MKNLGRIRWKCRRGMLELDQILLPFFDKHYKDLTNEQQGVFERLLDEDDPVLLAWFLKRSKPEDEEMCSMVMYISGLKD